MARKPSGQLTFADLLAAPARSKGPPATPEIATRSQVVKAVPAVQAVVPAATQAPSFAPTGDDDFAPSGERAKAAANLAALTLLRDLDGAAPTGAEQAVLARWSGWGSLADIFDDAKTSWAAERERLRSLLDPDGWAAARRTTLNAHYSSSLVVDAMWAAVLGLEFEGGRVLEPGCGSGVFIGLAPDLPMRITGVELDPTTARVAAALYPQADIQAVGFETTRFPEGYFDLVIGNVPFGALVLEDRQHNTQRHAIHNHFIVKSLRLVRPGGLVVLLTSRYTLDAANPSARREMAGLADLLGAVRLPSGAFGASAGTSVVEDLLVLRRRAPGVAPSGDAWDQLVPIERDGYALAHNEWWDRHPWAVLGDIRAGGLYRANELRVTPTGDLGPQLTAALDRIVASTTQRWQSVTEDEPELSPEALRKPEGGPKEGSLVSTPDGFARVVDGVLVPYEPTPQRDADELAAVIELRDTLAALLDAQLTSVDDGAFRDAQAYLNWTYDAYVARWGPLNRFTLGRTGRTDPETHEPVYRTLRPRMGGFGMDPDFYSLLALENFDPDTQRATKAAVFDSRVLAPRRHRQGADTPEDALAICLDQRGAVDLELIAGLLGVDTTAAREALGRLVWRDPEAGLVTEAVYLSGDVRHKLEAATAAAVRDDRWLANVEALTAVMPEDLGPDEIDCRLGAPWIGVQDIMAFARDAEIFGSETIGVEHADLTAEWAVHAGHAERVGVAATSTWGTARMNGYDLLEASLNQRTAQVFDYLSGGQRILNKEATLEAREKQEALEERFSSWVWQDDVRAARVAREYNRRFNTTVLARYDGSHLSLPGLNVTFTPHPHQRDAVWRILQDPTVLLAHVVGAGKTAVMIMAGQEMRRLGLVRKPCYVVENHMLDQFATEYLALYPTARVLVATKDRVTKAMRKHFVAQVATGDWDGVIITRSMFERIPVGHDAERRFVRSQLDALRAAAVTARNGAGLTVKRLEAQVARMEERLKGLLDPSRRDDGITLAASGIDYLFVDESQAYKNLAVPSSIQGVGSEGSLRSEDLLMKLGYLRGHFGARCVTFATATPIANTIAEMWAVQTYLQPEVLERAGIAPFDAWAAAFGRVVTTLELAPDGGSYRMVARLSRFRNVPELLRMFRAVADVRTKEQLALKTPAIWGGEAQTTVVEGTEALREFVRSLVDRAEAVRARRVTPKEDNILKICTDGRLAALDLRAAGGAAARHKAAVERLTVVLPAGPESTEDHSPKIAAAAANIARLYGQHRGCRYVDGTGRPARLPGALQLVFCDISTPRSDGGWNAYEELRDRLTILGVPGVRFIGEAKDDRAKAEMFAAARAGRISVLVGSTQKMGTGTNVQARLVAIHHLDCPWRPIDIGQRDGRGDRQGNQNDTLYIYRYVTEGSFDVFMWQTNERKAIFIHQVEAGDLVAREVEDVGDLALSISQVKALATGNPLIMEKAGLDNDVARLHRKLWAHQHDQSRLRGTLAAQLLMVERLERVEAQARAAIERRTDTRGGRFVLELDGHTYTDRRLGGVALITAMRAMVSSPGHRPLVGSLAGLSIEIERLHDRLGSSVTLSLSPSPIRDHHGADELASRDPLGLVSGLERRIRDLDLNLEGAERQLATARREVTQAETRIGLPFSEAEHLAALEARQREVEQLLRETLEERS